MNVMASREAKPVLKERMKQNYDRDRASVIAVDRQSLPMRVLFMQSQPFFGAETVIHVQLLRYFDRTVVEPHVALTTKELEDPALSAVRQVRAIPDLHVRPTNFGPSFDRANTMWTRVKRAAGSGLFPMSLLSLAAYIRRHGIQIIYGTEKPRDAFYGVLLGKLTGAKSVIHMHISYGDWQSPLVKWALRHADGIVGVSRFTAQSIIDAGFPSERVFAVHNSLDLARWDPTLNGQAERHKLGIPEDAPVLGIVARLFKWKGHGDLLHALAIVKQEMPNVRLVIVGEDDPRPHPGGGSYRTELEALASSLDLEDKIIFTGFRKDIPQLMSAFDVFVLPSWEEPFGIVFLEAMAMRKPVVGWASGGAPEVIVHNQTGLLAERSSIPSLAEAILTLLRQPSLSQEFGEEGRRRVEEVFNPQRLCQAMVEVYRSTLLAPRRARA